ncbi:hypothetical protein [Teichococcus deserti]|uniref:hypothetical protein n=1 Tax=Teichococcus deserti TaxID=1817963 RepID=UPI0013F5E939|nr:hypothetical protein [Pseudoroseomonas deserti]
MSNETPEPDSLPPQPGAAVEPAAPPATMTVEEGELDDALLDQVAGGGPRQAHFS